MFHDTQSNLPGHGGIVRLFFLKKCNLTASMGAGRLLEFEKDYRKKSEKK